MSMQFDQFNHGIFLVAVLGIVYDPHTKKILIGKRNDDPYVKGLSWCFPGGRPSYDDDLEASLQNMIKIKTGLKTKVERFIFARHYPENPEILAIYYLCSVGAKTDAQAQDSFVEVKWVKPTDVRDYFTTSLHPQIWEFLQSLD
ncbi:MAG: NUDIX hydrolase [Patescibacteria group bacterium]|nr:NUDIX hydrolase [Patescibacteria group bacterium]